MMTTLKTIWTSTSVRAAWPCGMDVAVPDRQQGGHREVERVHPGVEADDLVGVALGHDEEAEGEPQHREHQRDDQAVDAAFGVHQLEPDLDQDGDPEQRRVPTG